MSRTCINSILFVLFGLFIVNIVDAADRNPPNDNKSPTGGKHILNQVLSEYNTFLLEDSIENILYRQRYGLDITRLPDISVKKDAENTQKLRTFLLKLRDIKPGELSEADRLTMQLFQWQLENAIEAHNFVWLNFPIASYSNMIPYINITFTDFQFKEEKHLQNYLSLLEQYPAFIEELLSFTKKQMEMKIIMAKPALQSPVLYLHSIIQPGEKSLFYVTADRLNADCFTKNPENITAYQKQVSQLITTRINPALETFTALVEGDYTRQAPEEVGIWQYPQGKEYYRYLVKMNTTLELTPEQIHEIGLKEIETLLGKLDNIRKAVNFAGDMEAFIEYIKTDPGFRPKSADEIGKRMMKYKEQVEAKLPLFFAKLPKAPCGVKRLDPLLEASMTYGYYQHPTAADPSGYYLYNASNLEKKNVINTASASLILHELLPGHHFQIALQSENENLSDFRREFEITAYAEGWGEYAAELGYEMGIYTEPYDQLSRVMQDLFMSVRLVVDTGMNYFQWPREKARQLMKKYLLASDVQIESELLRYSTGIPAQALSYKIGSLKIWELRHKAEKILGEKFDIRRFHDVILGNGTLPLFILEEQVDRFIEKEKAN